MPDERWETLKAHLDRAYADVVRAAQAESDQWEARAMLRGAAIAVSAMVDGLPQCPDDIYAVLLDQLTTA